MNHAARATLSPSIHRVSCLKDTTPSVPGRTRTALGGAIDGTATVRFSATLTKPIGTPLEMMTEIANLPQVHSHYTVQWVAFASGRTPNPNDGCIVNQLSGNLANANYPVVNLIADYTATDSFRLRTVGN